MLRVCVTAMFVLFGTGAVAGGHEDPDSPGRGNSGSAPGQSGGAPGQSGSAPGQSGSGSGDGGALNPGSDTSYTGAGSDVEYYTLTAEDYELADEILALMLLLGEESAVQN